MGTRLRWLTNCFNQKKNPPYWGYKQTLIQSLMKKLKFILKYFFACEVQNRSAKCPILVVWSCKKSQNPNIYYVPLMSIMQNSNPNLIQKGVIMIQNFPTVLCVQSLSLYINKRVYWSLAMEYSLLVLIDPWQRLNVIWGHCTQSEIVAAFHVQAN